MVYFCPYYTKIVTNTEFELIKKQLNLIELPGEGGFYRETYRAKFATSHGSSRKNKINESRKNTRSTVTLIYYLLNGRDHFSAFHRLKSDEIWHFYKGSSVTIYIIDDEGRLTQFRLGTDIGHGEHCHVIIKAGLWFGARVEGGKSFALIGCTVTPGFDPNDFELGTRSELLRMFPKHKAIILSLTNEQTYDAYD